MHVFHIGSLLKYLVSLLYREDEGCFPEEQLEKDDCPRVHIVFLIKLISAYPIKNFRTSVGHAEGRFKVGLANLLVKALTEVNELDNEPLRYNNVRRLQVHVDNLVVFEKP